MIELSQWIASTPLNDKPWLVLGKGPTFSRRDEFDLGAYNTFALNHVVREVEVNVAHAIDIDVVEACEKELLTKCDWLLMPRRPHRHFAPGPLLLEDYVDRLEVLRKLNDRGRLVWYSSSTAPVGSAPVVKVRFFSAEAALSILAMMGVRTVRSLGIDGGTTYSAAFSDLESKTMLANTQPSFDVQFEEIEKIVTENAMDYSPLVEPARVFVGCDETQLVAARVLEYSIKKHASRPVQFTAMIDVPVPVPKDEANRARTGFSFYRFLIPKLSGYRGRALYLDADMQMFSDIDELWRISFGDRKVLCTYQTEPPKSWKDSSWFHPGRQMSVMLLDCSRLDWDIDGIVGGLDEGRYDYADLMFELGIVPQDEIGDDIPPEWNHLETFEEGRTKLTHYTVVPTQPWKNDENPLCGVWESCYREAVEAGAVEPGLVRDGIRKGHLKRSLEAALPLAGRGAGEPPLPGVREKFTGRMRALTLRSPGLSRLWRAWGRLTQR